MNAYVWWIIGLVIVLAVIAFLMVRAMQGRREEARREEASSLRDDAREQGRMVRHDQAIADETAAKARRAQAEADESAARAERLRIDSERREDTARAATTAHEEQLRRADALDPDVPTDDEGRRLDEPAAPEASGSRVSDPVGGGDPDAPLAGDQAAEATTQVPDEEGESDTPRARDADDRGLEVGDDDLRGDPSEARRRSDRVDDRRF